MRVIPSGTTEPATEPRCAPSPADVHGAIALLHYLRINFLVRVDAVEQELERSRRLSTERDFRSEHVQLALPDLRLGNRDALVEVLLAPRPATAQRVR